MRRLIAAILFAVLLAGCAQKSAFVDLVDGPCTGAQVALVDKHISGQINALTKRDWKLAYSFASSGFQAKVGVDDFSYIITAQYSMLIENQGFRFNNCTVADNSITQEVRVTSGGQVYDLSYNLSVIESSLGVESAVVTKADSKLSVA
jgi:hypothetical protein